MTHFLPFCKSLLLDALLYAAIVSMLRRRIRSFTLSVVRDSSLWRLSVRMEMEQRGSQQSSTYCEWNTRLQPKYSDSLQYIILDVKDDIIPNLPTLIPSNPYISDQIRTTLKHLSKPRPDPGQPPRKQPPRLRFYYYCESLNRPSQRP